MVRATHAAGDRVRERELAAEGVREQVLPGAVETELLAVAAWTDPAFRPPDLVRGRKLWWGLAILVNFVGPIAYFRWGRRQLR